jgi:hypothetical protein
VKPFGVYPFLYRAPPHIAQYLFSFVLCNWRWLDRGRCKDYPRFCSTCNCESTAWHILFDCSQFDQKRASFINLTCYAFEYSMLLINVPFIARQAAVIGKAIFDQICEMM